jgi:hypothetical protein
MKLSIRGMTIAGGLIWGGAILFVGLINMRLPNYGSTFLQMISSVYPGFHASRTLGDVAYGSILGLFDGAFGGLLIAWLYNVFAVGMPD